MVWDAAAPRAGLLLVLGSVLAVMALAACEVTAPSPTPPPRPPGTGIIVGTSSAPVQRVEIYYISALDWVSVGSNVSFGLFAVHGDGVYERLNPQQISWQSSNPAVIALQTPSFGTWRAVSPGVAVLTATYQGLSDSVTQEIRSGSPPFPYLDISPRSLPSEELGSAQVRARLHESPGSFPDVTAHATWSSSNPLVAIVDAGLVTATGVGTARITATYQGYSKSLVFSVTTSIRR